MGSDLKAGSFFRKIFLSILCLLALLFAWGMARAMWSAFSLALRQMSWEKTECLVESSSLAGSGSSESIDVKYHYTAKGVDLTGTQYSAPSPISYSGDTLQKAVERLRPGTSVICWFDPNNTTNAVLAKESLGEGFMLILPVLFALAGFFGLWALWSKNGPRASYSVHYSVKPEKLRGKGRLFLYFFFGLFMLVGLGTTYLFFLNPYLAVREAQTWGEQKCSIIKSGVASHTSTDSKTKQTSTSYSVEVMYEYTVNGRRYVGDVYGPAERSSSHWEPKSRIVESIPPGTEVACFVSPSDPTKATLVREFPTEMWLGLLPLIFFVAGLLGLVYSLSTSKQDEEDEINAVKNPGRKTKKAQSRLGGLLGLIGVIIVWNGIVAGVGYGMWSDWHYGNGSIVPVVIVAPFALIGLLLIVSLPYAFLQIFNPTLDLEYSPSRPAAGQLFNVSWKLNGRTGRIRKLEIKLELISQPVAIEADTEAKKRMLRKIRKHERNTGEKRPFFGETLISLSLINTDRPQMITQGTAQTRIEKELKEVMPGEKRVWRLTSRLAIPFYPDSTETIELPYD